MNPDGEVADRFTIHHIAAGLGQLVGRLLTAGAAEVGIERGDGPLVDLLLQAGLTVLVISPNQVKNVRSRYGSAGNRYGSAGNKDDRFDAYV